MEQLPNYNPEGDDDADRWLNEGGHLSDKEVDDTAENDSEAEPLVNDDDANSQS